MNLSLWKILDLCFSICCCCPRSLLLVGVLLLVVLHHVDEVLVLGHRKEHLQVELALLRVGVVAERLEGLKEVLHAHVAALNQL